VSSAAAPAVHQLSARHISGGRPTAGDDPPPLPRRRARHAGQWSFTDKYGLIYEYDFSRA